MGERVLKVKTVSDVAEAISGLTDLSGSLRNVGTAAIEAAGKSKGEWKALEAEWQKSSPTLKGVADAAFKVESALNAMGRAGTASKLESELVKSQVALNQYKAKLEEIRSAGGTIDEGMRHSLTVMEAGLEAGKGKLTEMKAEIVSAKEQLGLLADEGKKAGEEAERFGEAWRKGAYEAGEAARKAAAAQRKAAEESRKAAEEAKSGKNLTFLKQGLQDGAQLMAMLAGTIKVAQEVDKAFGGLSERYGSYRGRVEDARTAEVAHASALAAVEKGLITAGKTIEETARKWESYRANVLHAEETTNAFAEGIGLKVPKSFSQLNEEFARFNTAMQAADSEGRLKQFAVKNAEYAAQLREEYRLLGESVPAQLGKVIKASEDYAKSEAIAAEAKERSKNAGELALESLTREWELKQRIAEQARAIIAAAAEEAAATGNSAEANERANAALSSLAAQYGISKKALDEIIEGNREYDETLKEVAKSQDAATSAELARAQALEFGKKALQDSVAEYDQRIQQQREWITESTRAEQQMSQWINTTQGAGKAFGSLSGDFTQLNAAVADYIAQGGDVNKLQVGMSVLSIQVAAANERQIEQLKELLRLTRALKEEQLGVFDTAQGWTDYIAVMVDSFTNGFTSLQQLITGLSDFKTGLIQLYGQGGPGSAANEGLRDMLQSIQALINAAVGGQLKRGPTDPTPRGALERAFSGKRKK